MKKFYLSSIVFGIILSYSLVFAGMDMKEAEHDHSKMDHNSGHEMQEETDHSGHEMQDDITIVKSGGYKFTFDLIDMKEKMKSMDMKGMTHHLMVFVEDKSGKKVTDAKVKYKVFAPSKLMSETMAMAMNDGYGADVSMSEKGKYGVACLVVMGEKQELVKVYFRVK